jgi:hypothetical protein
MPGTVMLADYKANNLALALMLNPTAEYFPWVVQEYPQGTYPAGVPRSAVEAAFQSKIGADIAKGATFTNIYAAALVPDGVVLNASQVS